MSLAGTILFGGGSVSPRNFLIGLATVQALPGPNFNFAVYLSALAVGGHGSNLLSAILGYFGIFMPGLALCLGLLSIWQLVKNKPLVISALRGINAAAVGLVFVAIYKLWQVGYVTPHGNDGNSLAEEPFLVVIAVLTYAESAWFKVPTPVAIVAGPLLGLCWYGVMHSYRPDFLQV
ncbi:MAG: hypothetical protein MMC23_007531 [Stictis urceolatum]|nr:hypothetical protein [Stictis urceolata]